VIHGSVNCEKYVMEKMWFEFMLIQIIFWNESPSFLYGLYRKSGKSPFSCNINLKQTNLLMNLHFIDDIVMK
jgi:hypothetical protein